MSQACFRKTGSRLLREIANHLTRKDVSAAAAVFTTTWTWLCAFRPVDTLAQRNAYAPVSFHARRRERDGKLTFPLPVDEDGDGDELDLSGAGDDDARSWASSVAGLFKGTARPTGATRASAVGVVSGAASAAPDAAHRAMRLLLTGHFAEARRALDSDVTQLPINDEVVKKVIEPSLPAPPAEAEGEAEPTGHRRAAKFKPSFSRGDERIKRCGFVAKALNERRKKMGAGTDHTSFRQLAIIAAGASCVDASNSSIDDILTIIESIQAGLLREPAFAFMRKLRGIVLTKPDHAPDKISGRLIGIPSAFLRLAGAFALAESTANLLPAERAAMTGPLQHAVGSEAGHTGPALLLQALFDGAPQPKVLPFPPASQPTGGDAGGALADPARERAAGSSGRSAQRRGAARAADRLASLEPQQPATAAIGGTVRTRRSAKNGTPAEASAADAASAPRRRGGATSAGSEVATQTHTLPDEARCVLATDVRKAFHYLRHRSIREAVEARVPDLLWYYESLYETGALLEYTTAGGAVKSLPVRTGVVPGDPLGTFLFCVTLYHFVGSVLEQEFPDVLSPAFADDKNSALRVRQLEAFWRRLVELLGSIGCSVQEAKCEVLLCGGGADALAQLTAIAQRLGIRVAAEGIVVGGIPVGTVAFREAWCSALADKVIERQAKLTAALAAPGFQGLPRLQAYLMAARLTGPSSFSYATRGLAPSITQTAAERVDNALFDIVLSELGLRGAYMRLGDEQQERARTRFQLPKKLGGLSFHATVASGVGAYLGGVIAAASSLCRAVGDIDVGSFFEEASTVFDAAKAEIAQSSPSARITSFASFAEAAARAGPGFQHEVNEAFAKVEFRRLRDASTPAQLASLVGSTDKALAWLDASPRFWDYRLPDGAVRIEVAQVLGLPLTPHGLEAECPRCGCSAEDNPATGEHAYLCSRCPTRQKAATVMHIAGGAAIDSLRGSGFALYPFGGRFSRANRPGEITARQVCALIPAQLAHGGAGGAAGPASPGAGVPAPEACRFDLGFMDPSGSCHFVDFMRTASVCGATINNAAAAGVRGGRAKEGEEGKLNHYRDLFTNFDALAHHFSMAVIETRGAMSEGFEQLIQLIAHAAHPTDFTALGKQDPGGLRASCVAKLRQRFSVALVKANAVTVDDWLSVWPEPLPEYALSPYL